MRLVSDRPLLGTEPLAHAWGKRLLTRADVQICIFGKWIVEQLGSLFRAGGGDRIGLTGEPLDHGQNRGRQWYCLPLFIASTG